MKATKSRVYCRDCGRQKILFESESKALNFIKFNADDIEECGGYAPQRAYYCISCAGWHVTSKDDGFKGKSRSERAIAKYDAMLERKRIMNQELAAKKEEIRKKEIVIIEEVNNLVTNIRESYSNGDISQAKMFLSEAYMKLNVLWGMIDFKARKKILHKTLDELAVILNIKPTKIPF